MGDPLPQTYHDAFWRLIEENPDVKSAFISSDHGPLTPEQRKYCILADQKAREAMHEQGLA